MSVNVDKAETCKNILEMNDGTLSFWDSENTMKARKSDYSIVTKLILH